MSASATPSLKPIDFYRVANECKYLWHHGFDKEKLWRAYVSAVMSGWKDKRPLLMCDWQMSDCLDLLLYHPKAFWDWSRESGKTEWGSVFASFIGICGEEVYWMAKASAQFMRVQRLFNANPFCVPKRPYAQRKEVELINNNIISLQILDKEENASGPHPYLMVLDEFAQMDLELIAKAMFMPQENALFLFISTPVLGSPTTTFRHDPTFVTHTHTYLDCKWKNPKEVESRKVQGMEWKWDQDQLCREILPSGAVFKNVMETHTYPSPLLNIKAGVDFNGQKNMNIRVKIGFCGGQLYCMKEEAFQYKLDDDLLQSAVLDCPTEVESGFWNDIFAPNLRGVTKMSFGEDKGEVKIECVQLLLQQIIFINPQLCPHLLEDLRHAMWTTVNGKNKVDTSDLHYLAALMHAIHQRNRYIEASSTSTEIMKQELRRQRELRDARTPARVNEF